MKTEHRFQENGRSVLPLNPICAELSSHPIRAGGGVIYDPPLNFFPIRPMILNQKTSCQKMPKIGKIILLVIFLHLKTSKTKKNIQEKNYEKILQKSPNLSQHIFLT